MTITKTDIQTIDEAIQLYGEADILNLIRQALENRVYRQNYTRERNKAGREALRLVNAARTNPELAVALGLGTRS